jgi:hypothetical protein
MVRILTGLADKGKTCQHCGDPLPLWRRLLSIDACKDCCFRMAHGGQPMTLENRRAVEHALWYAMRPGDTVLHPKRKPTVSDPPK